MSTITFTKMQGLGNDFMVIDATEQPFTLTSKQIQALADRHRGIGFDQLLVLAPSSSEQADFTYLIFNGDGSSAEQCGNGARCLARFIHHRHRGMGQQRQWRLLTAGKITLLTLEEDDSVTVEMEEPHFEPARIPFITTQTHSPYSLKIDSQTLHFGITNVGNPHAVIVVEDAAQVDIERIGAQLSTHFHFPQGVNVGFMQVLTSDHIFLRVYERGTGPTLACGSGACAAVAVGRQMHLLNEQVQVTQPGGELWISWAGPSSPIRMRGPAHFVFTGKINLDDLSESAGEKNP